MSNENKNVNEIEEGTIMLDGDIFDRFTATSIALFEEIVKRAEAGQAVSEAEGEWANTFVEFADNLKLVTVKNNESDE